MYSIGLAEIVLIVKDVRASARFYREVVGLTPETEPNDEWAWFWAGSPGQPPRVALHKGSLLFEEQSPFSEFGERWGPVHYAFQVPRGKLAAAVDHVREESVEVYGPVVFAGMKATAFYFYDLDGNLLEFWSPDLEFGANGSDAV